MARLQRELRQHAQRLVSDALAAHPLFARRWPRLQVILSGSAVTEFADEYSGIDLIVLGDAGDLAELAEALRVGGLESDRPGLYEVTVEGRRVSLILLSLDEAARRLAEYDDFAWAVLPGAPVLHDPEGRLAALTAGLGEVPRSVWAEKIRARYRKFRRRQASIAWNLRRGQPYVLLENLTRLVGHALAICCYLDGKPPTGRKWIFQAAMRTNAGRRLRPYLFDLFSSLGETATLGGSYQAGNNSLYRRLVAVHDALVSAIQEAGYDVGRGGPKEALDR
ncbi:MAG: DUF4037 domain-containing protein [Thermaerobacter sp.]|nr:hypothetical protein [Bacillota bacterium]